MPALRSATWKRTLPTPWHFSMVINAIQPGRIKNEVAVIGAAITKKLAIDEIAGWIPEQFGHEFLQGVRIQTVPASVTLQRGGSNDEPAASFRVGGVAKPAPAFPSLGVHLPGQLDLSCVHERLHA